MDVLNGNWFTEKCNLWSDQCFSLEIQCILFRGKSQFQDILIVASKKFGNVLILDGIIQCTEKDEFTYHEMITFLPLCCHGTPKNVLVVGGGDGGVLREINKFPTVTNIDLVEIDEMVIEVSKKYLKNMAIGFESLKVNVYIKDGKEFLSNESVKNKYDVIITDSGDSVGPNETLFSDEYLKLLRLALNSEHGIVCIQAGCIWTDLELIIKRISVCRKVFKSVAYASINVPTYINGQIGFILASVKEMEFSKPTVNIELLDLKLRYYNNEMHFNAFSLPEFLKQQLKP